MSKSQIRHLIAAEKMEAIIELTHNRKIIEFLLVVIAKHLEQAGV